MTTQWENLLKAALLGTERQPVTFADERDALSSLLAQLNADERETALLQAAGAVALFQRAGRLPFSAPPLTTACELNDLPVINNRAALRLRMMLKDARYQPLLPEWLNAVAQRGLRLPAAALPKLLQLGADKNELREALLPTLGARGRWLAAQLSAKQGAAGQWVTGDTEDETIWHEGTREQRLGFLKRLRQRDATKARELLQSTWAQEAPPERADFIGLFITNLNSADEVFLESALDDKRKEVRTQAVELLARLPESAYVQRMIERTRSLIQFKRKLKGQSQLDIKMPAACDREMQRDGFEKSGNQISADDRQAWLRTLSAGIPPAAWSELLGESNHEWLSAVPKGRAGNALLEGLCEAAIRHAEDGWITALLPVLLPSAADADLPELFARLSKSGKKPSPSIGSHTLRFSIRRNRYALSCSLLPPSGVKALVKTC